MRHKKRTERDRLYDVWKRILDRCLDSTDVAYKNYGGRGIRVCKRWVHSFDSFLVDMGERPTGYTIERVDNDGNYTPENCIWASRKVQGRNKRNNVLLSYRGKTRTLAEWAERLSLSPAAIRQRLRRGYPLKDVFTKAHFSCTNIGVANGRAKLTEDDVRLIRKLRQRHINKPSHQKLAIRFGVTKHLISLIDRYKLWKHV